MEESIVRIQEDPELGAAYAVVRKGKYGVLVLLKEAECAIFDHGQLRREGPGARYLLLKHYVSGELAYWDFLKLIGKMCKKSPESKYFGSHIQEDNRMVCVGLGSEHMLAEDQDGLYEERLKKFREFMRDNWERFQDL